MMLIRLHPTPDLHLGHNLSLDWGPTGAAQQRWVWTDGAELRLMLAQGSSTGSGLNFLEALKLQGCACNSPAPSLDIQPKPRSREMGMAWSPRPCCRHSAPWRMSELDPTRCVRMEGGLGWASTALEAEGRPQAHPGCHQGLWNEKQRPRLQHVLMVT
ncbi:uncharacterized protein ACIB01_013757 [Guaruba guarouba]